MPRNPSKTRCAVPGCRAWAMRGRTRCRAHLHAELSPRGAGAPRGNLNALKNARYSDGLAEPDLDRLVAAATAAGRAGDFAYQFGLAVRALENRAADPFTLLLALDRILDRLVDRVAARLFRQELAQALAPLPALLREQIQGDLERHAARSGHKTALIVLRKSRRERGL